MDWESDPRTRRLTLRPEYGAEEGAPFALPLKSTLFGVLTRTSGPPSQCSNRTRQRATSRLGRSFVKVDTRLEVDTGN